MENKVYEIAKERILRKLEDAIESGEEFYWVQPWSNGAPRPISYTTGKPYRGVNRLILDPGEYITYKQIVELSKKNSEVSLRPGSKSYPVFFYRVHERKDDAGEVMLKEDGIPRKFFFMRYYRVYDIKDVIGLEPRIPIELYQHNGNEKAEAADGIIREYVKRESLGWKQESRTSQAYYSIGEHCVYVPVKERFKAEDMYFATLFHELVHSTGRHLCRFLGGLSGDEYAKEELTAEIGASMLCAQFGFDSPSCEENALAYLKHWADRIKVRGGQWAVSAASKAQAAVDYILNIEEEE